MILFLYKHPQNSHDQPQVVSVHTYKHGQWNHIKNWNLILKILYNFYIGKREGIMKRAVLRYKHNYSFLKGNNSFSLTFETHYLVIKRLSNEIVESYLYLSVCVCVCVSAPFSFEFQP